MKKLALKSLSFGTMSSSALVSSTRTKGSLTRGFITVSNPFRIFSLVEYNRKKKFSFCKIALLIITLFTIGLQINTSFAVDCGENGCVNIRVTEYIPGANCGDKIPITTKGENGEDKVTGSVYDCQVPKGAGAIVSMLGNILQYFTYIAALVGVLFIVYNGILYSMGGLDESFKTEAKKRIIGTLLGLVLLFLAGPLLQLIAPWIYK